MSAPLSRRGFLGALAAVLVLGAPCAAAAEPARIVVQVSDGDSRHWHTVLGNLHNIQADMGKDRVAIAVVAIGPGLDMLTADSLAANRVLDAMAAGVEFVACENTMKARQLGRSDMIDGIGYARAGYVEIIRRQQQGWLYLRP